MALRSPPPSGCGSGLGGVGVNGCARKVADTRSPAGPGRVECVLLHTSYCHAVMLPLPSSAARARRHHRRAERLPRVLLLAHPLHAHRPSGQRAREQRRVGGGIVRGVVAVAARAFDVDAMHAPGRHAEHLGERVAQRVDALTVRPHRHRVVLEEAHGARRADRRMHLIGTAIRRGHRLPVERGGRVAAEDHGVLAGRRWMKSSRRAAVAACAGAPTGRHRRARASR